MVVVQGRKRKLSEGDEELRGEADPIAWTSVEERIFSEVVVEFLSNQVPCYRSDSAGLEFLIAPTQSINKECLGALSELY